MLIADPSSTCDVCLEKFSSTRECWCIPCGHIFCRDCLNRLNQFVCPMCRTPMGKFNMLARPARKVHVDMAKCDGGSPSANGPDARKSRLLRKLERRLVTQTLEGRGLTVQRAAELADEVKEFLSTQSSNEHGLLKTIESLLYQLSASMARTYDDTSLTKGIKASYEHRIKQLEQTLKEQTRQLIAGRHAGDEPKRRASRVPRPEKQSAPKS